MNIGEILVRFGADIGGFMSGIRTATGALGSFGAAAVAATAIVAGLAVIIGVVSVKAAADFQQGMSRLVTGAGDTTDNMKQMGQAILGISTSTGVLTGQLLPAMYNIISAGQRGAQAQDTLRVAAMGSVAEQAKVVDVAKAVTTAMTDYGTTQYNATQFMNGYTQAVRMGRGTLEELSTSMGPILPLAKNLGISFADVAAAMSTMTNAGIPVERSATSLRFLFQSLEVPTTKAKNAMQSMGLSSLAVGNELKISLPGALEMIYKAAMRAGPEGSVPFNRAVSDMIGGQRSLQAFLALTGTHFATYSANAKAVADAMNASKTAVLGWDTAQTNFNVKLSQARAVFEALAIVVGSAILPVLSRLMDMLISLVSSFTQWVVQSHVVENAMHSLVSAIGTLVSVGVSIVAFFQRSELAMDGLKGAFVTIAIIILSALVPALWGAAIAAGVVVGEFLVMAAPFVLVGAAIAIAVAAFIHFYNTSAGFRGVVDQIVGALKLAGMWLLQVGGVMLNMVGPAITWLTGAVNWLAGAWRSIVTALSPAFSVLTFIGRFIATGLLPVMQQLWAFIVGDFVPVWHQLVSTWQGQFIPLLRQLWSALVPFAPLLQLVGMALLLVAGIVVGVVVVALVLLVAVLAGVARGLAGMLSGLITAFQGVVQIVTGALQILGGVVGLFTDLVTGKFDKLGADLGMIWAGIINIIVGAWRVISGIFMAAINLITGLVGGFIQALIVFFTTLYHALVGGSIVPDMCNAIVATFTGMIARVLALVGGFISSAIALFVSLGTQAVAAVVNAANRMVAAFTQMRSQAISTVQSLVSGVASTLSQLAGIAARAGSAMISALVGQINAGVGWVSSAINNVVAAIGNVLPHSPAKEGPLRDLNKFGPTITHGLAAGILAGSPEVRAAVNLMVQPFKAPMSGNVGIGAGGTHTGTSPTNDTRPLIVQIGTQEYRGFVQNLGRDLQGTIIIQKGGLR